MVTSDRITARQALLEVATVLDRAGVPRRIGRLGLGPLERIAILLRWGGGLTDQQIGVALMDAGRVFERLDNDPERRARIEALVDARLA